MNGKIHIKFLLLLLISILIGSCEEGQRQNQIDFSITDRLSQEPESLFPFYASGSQAGRILRLVYQSLMEVDPTSLDLLPVLAVEAPVVEKVGDTLTYQFEIRDEAVWDSGRSVRTQDIEFTIKSLLVPGLDKSGVHTYFTSLVDFRQMSDKEFRISFVGNAFLTEELISTLFIIPQHIYDVDGDLDDYAIMQLAQMSESDSILTQYRDKLEALILQENVYAGSNAYRVNRWVRQQGIGLAKKEDWWGDKIDPGNSAFDAYPSEINFALIPDPGTALTAFRNGQLDVLTDVNARDFKNLRQRQNNYEFYETTPMSFYYLCFNNQDEFLKDKTLRYVLASCFDAGKFIDTHMDSMGVVIYSPIHPSSPYFLVNENSRSHDTAHIFQVLSKNGYSLKGGVLQDSTGKIVRLEILVSEGALGKTMALLLKENVKALGIEITISSMKFSEIRKRLVAKDYQITPLSLSTNPFKYDPYQSWHSDNAAIRGSNMSGFSDSIADRAIELLRTTDSEEKRIQAYHEFQQRIFEEVPVLFVAAPIRCVITNGNYDVPVTPLSYAVNLAAVQAK